jgi:hypothetical protein
VSRLRRSGGQRTSLHHFVSWNASIVAKEANDPDIPIYKQAKAEYAKLQ